MTSKISSLELEKQISKFPNDQETVLTIGVFDGVHKGHQHLFKKLNNIASKTTKHSTVITFINHPNTILTSNFSPRYFIMQKKRLNL